MGLFHFNIQSGNINAGVGNVGLIPEAFKLFELKAFKGDVPFKHYNILLECFSFHFVQFLPATLHYQVFFSLLINAI